MSRKKETRMNPSLTVTLKKLQADSEIMVEPCDKRNAGSRVGRVLWEAQSYECPEDGHTKPGSPRGAMSGWAWDCEDLAGGVCKGQVTKVPSAHQPARAAPQRALKSRPDSSLLIQRCS